MTQSESLILVPAREGSGGVKNKNFNKLGDRHPVDRTVHFAKTLKDFGTVVISTDHKAYIEQHLASASTSPLARGGYADVSGIYLNYRLSKLSTAESHIMETIQTVVNDLETLTDKKFKGVLLLQPTTPFRNSEDFSMIREVLRQASEKTTFISVSNVGNMHPAKMYALDKESLTGNRVESFADYEQTRRQDLPDLFIRDGGFYYIGRDLVDGGIQVGNNPELMVRNFPWTINIDDESDMTLAKHYYKEVDRQIDEGGLSWSNL